MTLKQKRINAGNNFISMELKTRRLEAEVKRKEFKIRELKKSQQEYLKAEKEGLIVPMKIDDEGYPYVKLETEEK